MLLHKMPGLRQHPQRRRLANGLLQGLHHRHAQHRVLFTHHQQAAACPLLTPKNLGMARQLSALVLRLFRHQIGKGAQSGPVPGIGKRRLVSGAFGRAQVGVATAHQAAHIKHRFVVAHLSPSHKTGTQGLRASGQGGVHRQQTSVAFGLRHGQGEAQNAAPVLHHQHHPL